MAPRVVGNFTGVDSTPGGTASTGVKPQNSKAELLTGWAAETDDDARRGPLRWGVRTKPSANRHQHLVFVHGKETKRCDRALFIFHIDSAFRLCVIWLTEWKWFDRFILFLITTNSVVLATEDYRSEKKDPTIVEIRANLELAFTFLFTAECVLKIIAMGLIQRKHTYLRDGWNWLDFIVVVTGVVSLAASSSSSLGYLRMFRVLRPLRSLSVLPGMRLLVNTVLQSIPPLVDVALMALFLFTIFGILGSNFWGGVMHRRCRLTPQPLHFVPAGFPVDGSVGWTFPVNAGLVYLSQTHTWAPGFAIRPTLYGSEGLLEQNATEVYEAFCNEECQVAVAMGNEWWTWPVDGDQERMCGGRYECAASEDEDADAMRGMYDASERRTVCGSRFYHDENFGPPVYNSYLEGILMSGPTDEDTWVEGFNWGFTHFDHLGGAFLVLFQSCTLEGWVDIMYLLQDAHSDLFASIFFVLLVFIGSFFLLNVTLAIVWDAFENCEQKEEEFALDTDGDGIADKDPLLAESGEDLAEELLGDLTGSADISLAEEMGGKYAHGKDWLSCPLVHLAKVVVFSEIFQYVIMMFIVLNVITLSLDSYPANLTIEPVLAIINIIFAIVFVIEMVFIHVAIGPKAYWTNRTYAFDGIIVASSMMEFMMEGGGGSAMLALRGFRLLRVFKLAKKWRSFRLLLKAMVQTVLEMGNFVLLLSLMIIVFSLMGQVFFARRFHFHPDTGRPVPDDMLDEVCTSPIPSGYRYDTCVPRSHFDTFLWSVITIFQILSGENWNVVMYDGMRGAGWHAAFFFVICVVIGNFLVLNLFLAILMSNFEEESKRQRELELHQSPKAQQKMLSDTLSKNKNLQRFLGTSPYGKALKDLKEKQEDKEVESPSQLPKHAQTTDLGKCGASSSDDEKSSSSPSPKRSEKKLKSEPAPKHSKTKGVQQDLPGSLPEGTEAPSPGQKPPKSEKTPDASDRYMCTEPESDEVDLLERNPSAESVDSAITTDFQKYESHYISVRDSGAWATIKHICKTIISFSGFDNCILFCIIISSLCMALDNPLDNPSSAIQQFLWYTNVVFTIIFFAEMMLKIIVMGFILAKDSYLRNAWNILDFVIVCFSLLDFIGPMLLGGDAGNLSVLKTARILRAFRPLRLISRNPNLKLVVNTLFQSIPELCNLLVVGSFFFLLFGLLGMNMFKGTFNRCLDSELEQFSYDFMHLPGGITPLCIDSSTYAVNPNGYVDDSLHFLTSGNCSAMSLPYKRPTSDTPMCVLHCGKEKDGVTPKQCPEIGEDVALSDIDFDAPTWGYNVMRCSDCNREICGSSSLFKPSEDTSNTCRNRCTGTGPGFHPLFCQKSCKKGFDFDIEGSEDPEACKGCIEECVAQCECEDFCDGFNHDAATCVEQGGIWTAYLSQDFDNVGSSMRTLFEIATTEGWVDAMYAGTDATGPMMEPIRDVHEFYSFFFVAFILVGSFFVLNLCVGVIIDNFNKLKGKGHAVFMSEKQVQWCQAQKVVLQRKIYFPLINLDQLPPWRRELYEKVNSSLFDNVVMTCILLNTASMAVQVFPAPSPLYTEVLTFANIIFAVVFNLECFFKLLVLEVRYFQEVWNCFDFVCVLATNVGIACSVLFDAEFGGVAACVRMIRCARLFRLVRFAGGLNRLFRAFFLSIPKLANVGAILMLLLFLYAVLGVNLFAKVKMYGAHDEFGNFRDFYRAMVTLMRCMTGEAWNELMHSLSKDQYFFETIVGQRCINDMRITSEEYEQLTEDGFFELDGPVQCGTPVAFLYFISYTLLVTFCILNLFIAVIFEGFDDSQKAEERDILVTCQEIWPKYDPQLKMCLKLPQTLKFLEEIYLLMNKGKKKEKVVPIRRPMLKRASAGIAGYDDFFDFGSYNLQYALATDLLLFQEKGKDGAWTDWENIDSFTTFPQAVLAVVRRSITNLNPPDIQDLDKALSANSERERNMIKDLHNSANSRYIKPLVLSDFNKTYFATHVAAGKIQALRHSILFQRKHRREKREKKQRNLARKEEEKLEKHRQEMEASAEAARRNLETEVSLAMDTNPVAVGGIEVGNLRVGTQTSKREDDNLLC